MRILDDGIVRDATAEEEAAYEEWRRTTLPPDAEEALTRYANELTGQNDPDLLSATETLIQQRMEE